MLKDLLINYLAPGEIDRIGERVDGKATIIGKLGYNWIAVLDAQYRTLSVQWGLYSQDLPGLRPGYNADSGNATRQTSPAEILTFSATDLNSSEVNTTYLNTFLGAVAAEACTRYSVQGKMALLPNEQTGMFITSRDSFIDEHDPTVTSNPTKAMSSLTSVWTSTNGSTNSYARSVNKGHSRNESRQVACAVCPVLEIPAYEDRTGERIDDKATIIGRLGENWIAVLDAAYRGTAQYSVNNTTDISAGIPNTSGSYVVASNWSENQILAQQLYDTHSSKWNTDYLNQAQTATNFPAAKMCYDIMIDGKHAQLPSVQALAFVYSKRNYVDANDPTGGTLATSWISNMYAISSTSGLDTRYVVSINKSGGTQNTTQRIASYLVIPILEIPLYKDRTGERVDNKATIVGKLGKYWIAALDSIFRSQYVWSTEGNTTSSNFLSGTVTNFSLTCDEAVFLNEGFLKDKRTSAYATSMKNTQPAFKACLNTKLLGKDCALPTIQTMAFLRSWGSFVDSIDPTVTNPAVDVALGRAITYWTASFPGGTSDKAYRSEINNSGLQLKSWTLSVCPILEIPLWCDDDYK